MKDANEEFLKSLQLKYGNAGAWAYHAYYRAFSSLVTLDQMPMELVMVYSSPYGVPCGIRGCGRKGKAVIRGVYHEYTDEHEDPHLRNFEHLFRQIFDLMGGMNSQHVKLLMILMWNYGIETMREFLMRIPEIMASRAGEFDQKQKDIIAVTYKKVFESYFKLKFRDPVITVFRSPTNDIQYTLPVMERDDVYNIVNRICANVGWKAVKSGTWRESHIFVVVTEPKSETSQKNQTL